MNEQISHSENPHRKVGVFYLRRNSRWGCSGWFCLEKRVYDTYCDGGNPDKFWVRDLRWVGV